MHRLSAAAGPIASVAALALWPLPAGAADRTIVICDQQTNVCITKVVSGGHGVSGVSSSQPSGAADKQGRPPQSIADLCYFQPAAPPPPPSDPVWAGHRPGTGRVFVKSCPLKGRVGTLLVWLPTGVTPVSVTPAQLAQKAVAALRLPTPTFERSPTESNGDHGVPYTWVNLWTWYWTSPTAWRQVSRTARVGPVWATVTVRPTALVFEPGDGSAAVSCPGPGRAWTPADGDRAPNGGGCGFVFRRVTADGPVTASVAIRWKVSWTGSGGAGGTLPAMTTRASASFLVEQIQAVTR
jgi:hypothetical protein